MFKIDIDCNDQVMGDFGGTENNQVISRIGDKSLPSISLEGSYLALNILDMGFTLDEYYYLGF